MLELLATLVNAYACSLLFKPEQLVQLLKVFGWLCLLVCLANELGVDLVLLPRPLILHQVALERGR